MVQMKDGSFDLGKKKEERNRNGSVNIHTSADIGVSMFIIY